MVEICQMSVTGSKPDSNAIWKLKMQVSRKMMIQGLAFFHTKEYAELQRMILEVRKQEEQTCP
jgi:hypothetical protein